MTDNGFAGNFATRYRIIKKSALGKVFRMMKKARRLMTTVITLAALAGVSSCSQTTTELQSNAFLSGTEYLRGYGPVRPTPATAQFAGSSLPPARPVNDPVSFWEGGGSGTPRVEIKLGEQKAYFYKGNSLAGVSRISSGTPQHPTTVGTFRVTQKSASHRSNIYGSYVDSYGNVVVENVDVRKDKKPPGTRFKGASMPYFMRFNGGIGMHAGYLPGYPASHGCVRLPDWMAVHFYENLPHGSTVKVSY